MKYTIHQLEQAIEQCSANEQQILLKKNLAEAHAKFAHFKRNATMLTESNDSTSKHVEAAIDATESHLKDLKTPEDFQKFVEKNRGKVEEALKQMPEDKKPGYQKAWDLVCKAAKGTVKFIASNFVALTTAILIIVLGWVFRDELKKVWKFLKAVWDALTGKSGEKRHAAYLDQAKKTNAAAQEFKDANATKTRNEMYRAVVQDFEKTEDGQAMLKKLRALPVRYAKAMEAKNGAEKFAEEVAEDPSGIVTAFTKKDGAFVSSLQNLLHGISIKTAEAAGFEPNKDDKTGIKWDFFDIGYIQNDIDASKVNERFFKDVSKVEYDLYKACANAKDVLSAKRAMWEVYKKYASNSIDAEKLAFDVNMDAVKRRTDTWSQSISTTQLPMGPRF